MFLYSTVSTLNPIVGMVVTISPSFNLYKMVVLPAASRPTIRIRISFLPKRPERSLDTERPMLMVRKKKLEKLLVVGDGQTNEKS